MFNTNELQQIGAMANQIGKNVTAVSRISNTIAAIGDDNEAARLLNAERQNYCDGAKAMMAALANMIDGGGSK